MVRLGIIYTRQRRLEEAEPLLVKAVTVRRRLLGDDHADTLATLNNLAVLYQQQGRVAEAAKIDEEVVARRTRVLGMDHPLTFMSINNLANRYRRLGRYEEARQLAGQAVAMGAKVLGTSHPTYGVCVHTLGELDNAVGDLKSAERHLSEALATYRLQPGYEYVPLVLYQLAQVSARQKQTERAIQYLGEAVGKGYKPERTSPSIASDPHLASLHGNPAYEAIIAKLSVD